MKWLEIIELRSVGTDRNFLEREFRSLMEVLNKETEQLAIKVYDRAAVDSDLSIHLLHESSEVNINGSTLGLQLVSSLKRYGLINHSVWIEMHGK